MPLLASTIAVLLTTMIISVLKIFDVIYVMTSGNFGTEVIAVRMFKELFTFRNIGHASMISTLLLLLTIPVMYLQHPAVSARRRSFANGHG